MDDYEIMFWIEIRFFSHCDFFRSYYYSPSIYYLLFPRSFLHSKKTDIVELHPLCLQLILLACEVGLAVARLFATSRGKPGHAVLIAPSVRHCGRIYIIGTNTKNTF